MKIIITFLLFCSLIIACDEEDVLSNAAEEDTKDDTETVDTVSNTTDTLGVDTTSVIDIDTTFENFYSKDTEIYAPGDYISIPLPIEKLKLLDSITLTNASKPEIKEIDDNSAIIIPDNYIINEHEIWSMHQLKGYRNGEVLLQFDSLKIFRSRDIFNYVEVNFKGLSYSVKDSTFASSQTNPPGKSTVNISNETSDYSFTIDLNYNLYLPELASGTDLGDKGTHYRQFGTYKDLIFPYKAQKKENKIDIHSITYIIKTSFDPSEGPTTDYNTIKSLNLNGFSLEDKLNKHRFRTLLDNSQLNNLNPTLYDNDYTYQSELLSSTYYLEIYRGKEKYDFNFATANSLEIILERR